MTHHQATPDDTVLNTEVIARTALRILTEELVSDLCARLRAEARRDPASPWVRRVLLAGRQRPEEKQ
jgi:hypothetical protein